MSGIPPMLFPVLGAMVAGLAISLPVSWLLVRVGHRMGALELRAVPNIGGVGIFLGIALPLLGGLLGVWMIDEATWGRLIPAIEPHLERIRETSPTAMAMLGCMTLLHVMGLVDDRKGLGPLPKFIVQFTVAGVMTFFFDVRLLTMLDVYMPGASIAVTIIWIVGITNAGTCDFNIEIRAKNDRFTAVSAIDVLSADAQAATTPITKTSPTGFDGATILADRWLVGTVSAVASSPGFITINVKATYD